MHSEVAAPGTDDLRALGNTPRTLPQITITGFSMSASFLSID
jgi:hypothetical protein